MVLRESRPSDNGTILRPTMHEQNNASRALDAGFGKYAGYPCNSLDGPTPFNSWSDKNRNCESMLQRLRSIALSFSPSGPSPAAAAQVPANGAMTESAGNAPLRMADLILEGNLHTRSGATATTFRR